uniref:Uncharacterized protein n=1 Tax=viral metagenome TaxID=1070528 RepID=A0A6C0JWE1_9ZZZZ
MISYYEKIFENTTPYFLGTLLILHACLFFIFIGVLYVNPNLVETISNSVRLFVCLFLLIRFHPFRKYILHKYDGQVIFTAALFLLTNEAIEKYILSKRNDASKSIIKIGKISEDGQENQSSSQ